MPKQKKGTKGNKHKFGGRNNGPARERYWMGHKLEKHKVDHLMKHNGMTRAEATKHWHSVRTKRIKTR